MPVGKPEDSARARRRQGEGNHSRDQRAGLQGPKPAPGPPDPRDRKKRDDLQDVIAFVRGKDFGVATNFKNFRD